MPAPGQDPTNLIKIPCCLERGGKMLLLFEVTLHWLDKLFIQVNLIYHEGFSLNTFLL